MIKELTVCITPDRAGNPEELEKVINSKLTASDGRLNDWVVTRRSIDARKKPVKLNMRILCATGKDRRVESGYRPVDFKPLSPDAESVVIVGAGPAGLFAALRCIEYGMKPIVLERGKDVDSRRADITRISREGVVDPDSNYCFGEGGAGTFSDGKLYTRSKKRGDNREILSLLHQHGAPESILIDSHPHIGSDCLPHIMKRIRERILECGGEVRFNSRVTGLLIEEGDMAREVRGVLLMNGEEVKGPVVLATGHSARDVYRFLHESGVSLEPKGLAIGVRLEHPQRLIDSIQYHTGEGRGEWLPAAEYNFVARVKERGVYSFCMCPGGVIVPAASAPGESVANGMSASARASVWANSGMVVEIHPGDFPEYTGAGVFEMMELQEDLEKRYFEAAGRTLAAPAQRMKDFVNGKLSRTLPPSSYLPGVISCRVDELLPSFISERLKEGFRQFGRRAKGFLTNDAMLVGLESRTSSPIRVPRDPETLEHLEVCGLYPAGEGAGYAGGIVSAAIDGRRCVDAIKNKITNG